MSEEPEKTTAEAVAEFTELLDQSTLGSPAAKHIQSLSPTPQKAPYDPWAFTCDNCGVPLNKGGVCPVALHYGEC